MTSTSGSISSSRTAVTASSIAASIASAGRGQARPPATQRVRLSVIGSNVAPVAGGTRRRDDEWVGVAASGPPPKGRPGIRFSYGATRLMRVPQFASDVRVLPHVNCGELGVSATYCWKVHVWPMYSEAIQIELPSTAVAP